MNRSMQVGLRLQEQVDKLLKSAQQADAYIRHAIDTGNKINGNAVPLLKLREAIAKAVRP